MITRRNLIKIAAAASIIPLSGPVRADTLSERYKDLYEAAKKDGKVVFYTSYRQETSTQILEFWRQNFPDVSLSIVQKQTLDLIPTIEAEKAAGRTNVDLALITQRYIANDWVKRGFIEPYKVRDFDRYAPEFKDADGNFLVTAAFLLSAAYNTKAHPDPSVLPRSLEAFLDPKWKGHIVFSDPKTAASQLAWFQVLLSKGIIDWNFIERFAKQDILFTRGNAESVRLLAAGERDISPLISSQNVVTAKQAGQDVDLYVLDEGAVVLESLQTIFKGSPNPNAAKLLAEVLAAPEAQAIVADTGSYWPTHPDAAPPKGVPSLKDLKLIANTEDVGGDASNQFLEKFSEVFGRE